MKQKDKEEKEKYRERERKRGREERYKKNEWKNTGLRFFSFVVKLKRICTFHSKLLEKL